MRYLKSIPYVLAVLLLSIKADSAVGADDSLRVHFEYAARRNALVVQVLINRKPCRLIVDTGSAHTIVQAAFLGIKDHELTPVPPGAGFTGYAINREVAFQIGDRNWPKRQIVVMDMAQILSAYDQRVDGLIGLDFLQEFSSISIDLKNKTITLAGHRDKPPVVESK